MGDHLIGFQPKRRNNSKDYINRGVIMFNNIGKKIKKYAEIVSWIGIIASIIIGVLIVIGGTVNAEVSAALYGILYALIGSLISWVLGFVLYGFGQLVDNSDILVKKLVPEYKEEINNDEEIEEISNIELEKGSNEYSNSIWEESIKDLSNEELQERINSTEWQYEYRVMCKKELEKRKQQ